MLAIQPASVQRMVSVFSLKPINFLMEFPKGGCVDFTYSAADLPYYAVMKFKPVGEDTFLPMVNMQRWGRNDDQLFLWSPKLKVVMVNSQGISLPTTGSAVLTSLLVLLYREAAYTLYIDPKIVTGPFTPDPE